MKTFVGSGRIWDAKKNGVLCKFNNKGILKTYDEYVIKRLYELGYEEANSSDMVSIDLCNSVNVDWREKYEKSEENYRFLKMEYAKLEKELNDIKESMVLPKANNNVEDLIESDKDDHFLIGDVFIPKNYAELNVMKLKSLLSQLGFDMKVLRKYSKDKTLTTMTKFLTEKGYLQ